MVVEGDRVLIVLARVEPVPVILFLTLLLSAAAVFRHKVCYHVRVVEKGRLIRSGELGRLGLWWMWRRHGIRTVVSLVSDDERRRGTKSEQEVLFCLEKGIEWVHLPIRPGLLPKLGQVHRFLEICRNDDRRPVLVHCKQGVVRTNVMVAAYLKERFGRPNEQILRELPLFGHALHSRRYERMREFILRYGATTEGEARGAPQHSDRAAMDGGRKAGTRAETII